MRPQPRKSRRDFDEIGPTELNLSSRDEKSVSAWSTKNGVGGKKERDVKI